MKIMQNSWLSSVRTAQYLGCLSFFGAIVPSAAQATAASPSTLCARTPDAKQEALVVVDSRYRRFDAKTVQLPAIDFGQSREIRGLFLVISPMRAEPGTSLDDTFIHSSLDLLEKCARKKIYGLNFSFDSSPLRPGEFMERLSIFQDEFGMQGKPIASPVEFVSGMIQRFWIAAQVVSSADQDSRSFKLRLSNVGNVESPPLSFSTIDQPTFSGHVSTNECQARVLAPGQACVVEFTSSSPAKADESYDWPVEFQAKGMVTIQFERRHGSLSVDVLNR